MKKPKTPKNTVESERAAFRTWKRKHGEKAKMKMKFGAGQYQPKNNDVKQIF